MAKGSGKLPNGEIIEWEVEPGGRPPFPTDLSPEGMALRSLVSPAEALAAVRREKDDPPTGPLRRGAPGYGDWVAPL